MKRVLLLACLALMLTATSASAERDITEVASVAEESSASAEQVSASTQQTAASTQEIAVSAGGLATSAEQLHAIGQPTRCRILWRLLDGPASIQELARALGAAKGTIGHHVRVL